MPNATSKPATIEDYCAWARDHLLVDFNASAERSRFDTNLRSALTTFRNSAFGQALPARLLNAHDRFMTLRGARLLTQGNEPTFVLKPYDSAVNKSFRYNVLWNREFPDRPRNRDWIKPDTWYHQINDLVRSLTVCTFIDGPEFLAQELAHLATSSSLVSRLAFEARDEGYYALHFYVTFPTEILDVNWQPQRVSMTAELQLTTQLQDVIRQLTRPHYEHLRLQGKPDDSWKWQVQSDRFKASYLGHTIHLLESIILQLRQSPK